MGPYKSQKTGNMTFLTDCCTWNFFFISVSVSMNLSMDYDFHQKLTLTYEYEASYSSNDFPWLDEVVHWSLIFPRCLSSLRHMVAPLLGKMIILVPWSLEISLACLGSCFGENGTYVFIFPCLAYVFRCVCACCLVECDVANSISWAVIGCWSKSGGISV